MLAFLAAAWLCMPVVPLNPVEEDTLSDWSVHVTLGLATPNHFIDAAPDLTLKLEKLWTHPLILRAALDYQYGQLNPKYIFDGTSHQFTLSLCALYYRGTDRLTGYLGAGPVLRVGDVGPSVGSSDSLWNYHRINKVDIQPDFGYRIVLGARLKKMLSLELVVTEVTTDLEYISQRGPSEQGIRREETNLSSVRLSLGYIMPLRN